MRLSLFSHLRSGLLLLSSLLTLSAVAQRSPSLPSPKRSGTEAGAPKQVPLEVLPSGHVVVKATVNGVEGRFYLDTGAGLTVLTKRFAQRVPDLQLQDGRFTGLRAIGERLDVPLYAAPAITVGGWVADKASLSVYDGEMGEGIDGLLALTAFRHQPFTIEYDRKQLVLETPVSLAQRRRTGRAVALRTDDTYGQSLDMAAYCRVNEKLTLLVVLDSGSPVNQYWLNAAFAPTLGIDTVGLKRTIIPSGFSAAHQNVLYHATLAKLTPVEQPSIALTAVPVGLMTGLIHDGILPLNWLGNQLTIDLPHQVLFAH